MTPNEFRQWVRSAYPHVKISIRTVSFQDLARASAKCLTITGEQTNDETRAINLKAQEAGILPDSSLRGYPNPL